MATAAFLAAMNASITQAVVLLKLVLPRPGLAAVTYYLSTRDMTTPDGQRWQAAIADPGTVRMPGSCLSSDLELCSCSPVLIMAAPIVAGATLGSLLATCQWVGAEATLWLWHLDLTDWADAQQFGPFDVQSFEADGPTLRLDLRQRTDWNGPITPKAVSRDWAPNAPEEAVGAVVPIVYGRLPGLTARRPQWSEDYPLSNVYERVRGGKGTAGGVLVDPGRGSLKAKVLFASHECAEFGDQATGSSPFFEVPGGLAPIKPVPGDLFNADATGTGVLLPDDTGYAYVGLWPAQLLVGARAANTEEAPALLDPFNDQTFCRVSPADTLETESNPYLGLTVYLPAFDPTIGDVVSVTGLVVYRSSGVSGRRLEFGQHGFVQNEQHAIEANTDWTVWEVGLTPQSGWDPLDPFAFAVVNESPPPSIAGTVDIALVGVEVKVTPKESNLKVVQKYVTVTRQRPTKRWLSGRTAPGTYSYHSPYSTSDFLPPEQGVKSKFYANLSGQPDDMAGTYTGAAYRVTIGYGVNDRIEWAGQLATLDAGSYSLDDFIEHANARIRAQQPYCTLHYGFRVITGLNDDFFFRQIEPWQDRHAILLPGEYTGAAYAAELERAMLAASSAGRVWDVTYLGNKRFRFDSDVAFMFPYESQYAGFHIGHLDTSALVGSIYRIESPQVRNGDRWWFAIQHLAGFSIDCDHARSVFPSLGFGDDQVFIIWGDSHVDALSVLELERVVIERPCDVALHMLTKYGEQTAGDFVTAAAHGSFADARADLQTWRATDMILGFGISEPTDVMTALAWVANACMSRVTLSPYDDKFRFLSWGAERATTRAAIKRAQFIGEPLVSTTPASDLTTALRVSYGRDEQSGGYLYETYLSPSRSCAGYKYLNLADESLATISGATDAIDVTDGASPETVLLGTVANDLEDFYAALLAMFCTAFPAPLGNKWAFAIGGQVDATCNRINIYDGVGSYALTIPAGSYMMEELAAAVAAACNVVSTAWYCTYSRTTRKFTIGRTAGTCLVTFVPVAVAGSLAAHLGLAPIAYSGSASYTSEFAVEEGLFALSADATFQILWRSGASGYLLNDPPLSAYAVLGFSTYDDTALAYWATGTAPKGTRQAMMLETVQRYIKATSTSAARRETTIEARCIQDTDTALELRNRIADAMSRPHVVVGGNVRALIGLERGELIEFDDAAFALFYPYPDADTDGLWTGKQFVVVEAEQHLGPDNFGTEIVAVSI